MELFRNRSFTLTTDDNKLSRLRHFKKRSFSGIALGPTMVHFNIYTHSLPSTIFRKFAYANNQALLHSSKSSKNLEGILGQDMTTLSAYLQTWKLKLSHIKTVTGAFYFNNRETKPELKVYNSNRLLPFHPYLSWGKTEQIAHVSAPSSGIVKKIIFKCHIAEATGRLRMDAGAKTLRAAALSLVHLKAEYCAPI